MSASYPKPSMSFPSRISKSNNGKRGLLLASFPVRKCSSALKYEESAKHAGCFALSVWNARAGHKESRSNVRGCQQHQQPLP